MMIDLDFKKLKSEVLAEPEKMPRHIAFIMDGNGRWAKKRGLPRLLGHREGVASVREMVEIGSEIGIKEMTFYTFSTENWKRPEAEVSGLMKLLVSTIRKEAEDLDKNNVSLKTIGCLEDLPELPKKELEAAKQRLKKNTGLVLTLALSYGGRQDICKAVNKLIASGETIVDEKKIADALDTAGSMEPDLMVRTSGEFRISNFLLWESAYTEFYVTDTFWPDFRKKELLKAIRVYQQRERRFGCTSEQLVK